MRSVDRTWAFLTAVRSTVQGIRTCESCAPSTRAAHFGPCMSSICRLPNCCLRAGPEVRNTSRAGSWVVKPSAFTSVAPRLTTCSPLVDSMVSMMDSVDGGIRQIVRRPDVWRRLAQRAGGAPRGPTGRTSDPPPHGWPSAKTPWARARLAQPGLRRQKCRSLCFGNNVYYILI